MGDAATDQLNAYEVLNPDGRGPALLLCEHASNHIPERYADLGLSEEARVSHVAWDPGARALALLLSSALASPLIASCVSRLVYDCNRPPDLAAAMPETSEVFEVQGNRNLTKSQRQERVDTVYEPFCAAVSNAIATRQAAGLATVLITIHSFTPVYFGQKRSVEIGILHDKDCRMADAMLAQSAQLPHRRVERNMPYGPEDGVTHSLKIHGQMNGLANVMLEVRNDLLRSADDQRAMAQELLLLIRPALAALDLSFEGAPRA